MIFKDRHRSHDIQRWAQITWPSDMDTYYMTFRDGQNHMTFRVGHKLQHIQKMTTNYITFIWLYVYGRNRGW